MSLLREIEWEPCLLESRPDPELSARLRKRFGRVSPSTHYFAPCPDLSESIAALNRLLLIRVSVDQPLIDKVGVVVSQDNSCRYCYAVQRAMMIAVGVSEEKLRKLAQEVHTGDLSRSEKAALEFTRRVSRANPLPQRSDAVRLEQAGFTETQVRELAGVIAVNVFFNRLSTLPALPPGRMEALPDRWFVKLLRPLLGYYVERMYRSMTPKLLSAEEMEGPFSPVVQAMNGLPLARELRALIDTLLVDDALPKRTKALVFAIVGRALGCENSVVEGTRVAVEAGLDPSSVEQTLNHFVSDELSETEMQVLRLSRETVWYQPASMQRRARQVRDELTTPQFIECIVAASTANMVCRLCSVVLDQP